MSARKNSSSSPSYQADTMNPPSDASPDSALAAFWQQARQYVPRTRQLRAVAHTRTQAAPGDVWLTQPPDLADGEPAEPLTVLLLERFEGEDGDPDVFTAAPIFSDPSVAGPSDAVLPHEILGFEAGIAFASAASVLGESLMTCEGALPEDWISRLTAFHDYVRGFAAHPPSGIVTGAPYLDENDPAFIFHENLAEQMQVLATSVLPWALNELVMSSESSTIQAYTPATASHLGLAASSDFPAAVVEVLHVGEKARIKLIEQPGEPGVYRARILEDPLNELNGGEIISSVKNAILATLSATAGSAKFSGKDGILVRRADGRLLGLRKMAD